MKFFIADGDFNLHDYQLFGAPRDDGRRHEGIDLTNGSRFPIYAAETGVIARRPFNPIAGWSFWLYHANGDKSLYCHIEKMDYDALPQQVVRGQCLGRAGKSGNATAVVLHYEIHKFGKAIDPYNYILDTRDMIEIKGKMKSVGSVPVYDSRGVRKGMSGSNVVREFDQLVESTGYGGKGNFILHITKTSDWLHIADVEILETIMGQILLRPFDDNSAEIKLAQIEQILAGGK